MRLSVKFAGVCSSGAFLLTLVVALWQHVKPEGDLLAVGMELPLWTDLFQMLVMSLSAATVAGLLGYLMGDILSKPKGQRKPASSPEGPPPAAVEPGPGMESGAEAEGPDGPMPVLEAAPAEER